MPKTIPQSCRSCVFLRVRPDAKGRRAPRADKSYPCMFRPPVPVLPDSLRFDNRLVRLELAVSRNPNLPEQHRRMEFWGSGSFMEPNEGTSCPTYEAINPGGQRT